MERQNDSFKGSSQVLLAYYWEDFLCLVLGGNVKLNYAIIYTIIGFIVCYEVD